MQHLFANIHIPKCTLTEMNNKTVHLVRKWMGLNTHSTRDLIFHKRSEGGLGVPNVEWIYTATRINHLVRMLNIDDAAVREQARASLLLDLSKSHTQQQRPTFWDSEKSLVGNWMCAH